MLGDINKRFNEQKDRILGDRFIAEAAMDVEEVLPGSEDEMDDIVDSDSVPEDVYKKLDAALDKLIDDPNYDDTEVEELLDDDGSDLGISDAEIEAVLDECAAEMGAVDESVASKAKFVAKYAAHKAKNAVTGKKDDDNEEITKPRIVSDDEVPKEIRDKADKAEKGAKNESAIDAIRAMLGGQ